MCLLPRDLPSSFIMTHLPLDFHTPPEGYSYEVRQFKRNVSAIWICNHGIFSYTSDTPKSIWGFFDTKKGQYHAPINPKKVGSVVELSQTTPYSAMQIRHDFNENT